MLFNISCFSATSPGAELIGSDEINYDYCKKPSKRQSDGRVADVTKPKQDEQ